MSEISDVDLMQLADGTLPETARRRVEAQVASSRELQERVTAFRTTGKVLARLFEPVTSEPVPDRLLQTILQHPPEPSPRVVRRAAMPSIWEKLTEGWLSPQWGHRGLAYAALATMVLGAGWWLADQPSHSVPEIVASASPSVARALDATPSNQVTEFALSGHGMVALRVESSFRHKDGRYCRQYEVELGAGKGSIGIACRMASGGWNVESDVAAPVSVSHERRRVSPAGPMDEEARARALAATDAAASRMSAGDVMQVGEEAKLISRGWSEPK